MRKTIITAFTSLCLLIMMLPLFSVQAGLQDAFKTGGGSNNDPLNQAAQEAGYDTSQTSPDPIIETIIQVALSFLGVIFLILTIYGGFLWMTASGNEEQITKARKILTAAVVGLVIVLASYALSQLVIGRLSGDVLNS